MGFYLNSNNPVDSYVKECNSPYFVDKSMILEELSGRIQTSMNYICVTRPRRFGKSVMANMIATYFSRDMKAEEIFESLKIAGSPTYQDNCGQ